MNISKNLVFVTCASTLLVSGCSIFQDPSGSKMYLEAYDQQSTPAATAVPQTEVVTTETDTDEPQESQTYAYSDVVTVPQPFPEPVGAAVPFEATPPEIPQQVNYSETYHVTAADPQPQTDAREMNAGAEMVGQDALADIIEVPAGFVKIDQAESGYYLQAAAFSSRENASRFADTLRESDLNRVVIVEDSSSGRLLYKPQVGPFETVQEALEVTAKLSAAGVDNPGLIKH